MDNIQDRVDNWRKKIEEKKDKNEKLSEKEAKIILNEAIDISSGLVEDIINDFDILPMPKGRGFLDTNDTCLLK